MARSVVLLVGEERATLARLAAHLARRGLKPRLVADCGEALLLLERARRNGRVGAKGSVRAIVLDIASAGVGARAFREMLQADEPTLAVLEIPPDEVGPEDVGLLGAALEEEVRRATRLAEASVEAAGQEEDSYEGPLHGVRFEQLESRNARMHELFALLPRIARADSPVLVVGETGTGKELVAAALHRQSGRRDGEFFTVNCGALTDTLLESELFGHERGAFTGAIKMKKGYFELASGGTLFLDELGTISHSMQVKLLRVLEERMVRRVGGSQTMPVDVRIVGATNEDLEEAVARGDFRQDLYYRLNVVQLRIPPLRERTEDIVLLAEIFRERFSAAMGRSEVQSLSARARLRLEGHLWPGNVRELQNTIQRAMLLAAGPAIEETDLPERLRRPDAPRRAALPSFDLERPLDEVLSSLQSSVEREYLQRLLGRYGGQVGRVAAHAGLNRRTLYNKLRSHGLDRRNYR